MAAAENSRIDAKSERPIFILSGLRFNSAVLFIFLRQDESLDSPSSLESA